MKSAVVPSGADIASQDIAISNCIAISFLFSISYDMVVGFHVVTTLVLALTLPHLLRAEDSKQVHRLVNARGWAFPGEEALAGKKPDSTMVVSLDGILVEISTFSNLPTWDRRQKRYMTAKVLFAVGSGDSITIVEKDWVANKVIRYRVGNRAFLYTMLAYPCSGGSKEPGGCAGADVKLAYYDEDGDGKFEVMEQVNPILSSDPSQNWKPKIPRWAANSSPRE